MYNFDHRLFLWLNFDGGHFTDSLMETISGTAMWIPLYVLILYMVWRKYSWRGALIFVVCLAAAMAAADIISGIFKHTGPLKHLWATLPPRPRPMFTDSLAPFIHVPSFAHGQFGTVSSHASTVAALAMLSSAAVGRRWFTWTMVGVVVLICYSRIYLACHFPADLALGCAVGVLTGSVMWLVFKRFATKK